MSSTSVVEQSFHNTNRLAEKLRLRRAYVKGEGSLEALCLKANVPVKTAQNWFQDEGWIRLKQQYDAQDLSRLMHGSIAAQAEQAAIGQSVTEKQLNRVNEALLSCDDADETLKLARAKQTLEECLSVERNGAKPGTLKPRAVKRGGSAQVYSTPEISTSAPLEQVSQHLAQPKTATDETPASQPPST
jgi:hypothetical protein